MPTMSFHIPILFRSHLFPAMAAHYLFMEVSATMCRFLTKRYYYNEAVGRVDTPRKEPTAIRSRLLYNEAKRLSRYTT